MPFFFRLQNIIEEDLHAAHLFLGNENRGPLPEGGDRLFWAERMGRDHRGDHVLFDGRFQKLVAVDPHDVQNGNVENLVFKVCPGLFEGGCLHHNALRRGIVTAILARLLSSSPRQCYNAHGIRISSYQGCMLYFAHDTRRKEMSLEVMHIRRMTRGDVMENIH
jgi:hypothetical protein